MLSAFYSSAVEILAQARLARMSPRNAFLHSIAMLINILSLVLRCGLVVSQVFIHLVIVNCLNVEFPSTSSALAAMRWCSCSWLANDFLCLNRAANAAKHIQFLEPWLRFWKPCRPRHRRNSGHDHDANVQLIRVPIRHAEFLPVCVPPTEPRS